MKEKRKQSLHSSMFSVYSVAQATGTNDLSQHKQSEAEHLAIYLNITHLNILRAIAIPAELLPDFLLPVLYGCIT